MPGLGIDPRTGELIVLPGGSSGGTWGPSQGAQDQAQREVSRFRGDVSWERNWEEWQRSDASWIQRLIEDYWQEKGQAQAKAKQEAAYKVAFGDPYMTMAVMEARVDPELLLTSPAVFSEVARLAFLKYQEDVKRAWQEGKGPLRPLTAEEFVAQIIARGGGTEQGYIIGLTGSENKPFTPTHILGPYPELAFDPSNPWSVPTGWYGTGRMVMWGPGVLGNYGVMPLEEGYQLPDLLLVAKRFFPWVTDEAWWLSDPEYRAFNPQAAPGYGKVSPAPPGFQKVQEGIYQDPATGFLYFVGTGAYLGHGFLATWQQDQTLGKPVTNEFEKDGKVYQVFEGGILAYDPETGEIQRFRNAPEAGLDLETIKKNLTEPKAWTDTGKEVPLESHVSPWTWTTDPYLGKGSDYYDKSPATVKLPDQAPSAYPHYGFPGEDIQVSEKAVWIKGSNGQFQEPDPWIRDQFMGKIRTDPQLKDWYYSLSDEDRNKVFANYIATGQIYL